ncbi:MAG: hypothetical protein ACOY33_10250 [Pseudomonadota bacterium]
MNSSSLLGRSVKLRANEFVGIDLAAKIVGISDAERKALLILDEPLVSGGTAYCHVVAAPRLAQDGFHALADRGLLGCALTWVPAQQFDQARPYDLTWWRGGGVAITDLLLAY